tara:strand:+ start:4266 stop:4523 length:258 start_codon:yes stop_codon:yes gene_type:complete
VKEINLKNRERLNKIFVFLIFFYYLYLKMKEVMYKKDIKTLIKGLSEEQKDKLLYFLISNFRNHPNDQSFGKQMRLDMRKELAHL